MVKPRIIEKIKEYNATVDSFGTTVLNEQMLSAATVKQLREILVSVVENGTATNLKTDYLRVAGKTGTAVIAQGKQGYKNGGKKIYQASFCGYFPANDPQYSMIVVINSPGTNGYYGNVVAGSIFKEVADKVYSLNLNMHKSVNRDVTASSKVPAIQNAQSTDLKAIYAFLGVKVDESETEWANTTTQGKKIMLEEKEVKAGVVPDVRGMSLKDALYLLETMGMKVTVNGSGSVRKQSVTPGERLMKGMPVIIELS